MEPKELGLKLIDAISVSVNELSNKVNCLNSLGYKVDISTIFKKEVSSFLGQDVIEAEYTLLIYKEQPNE
jgi:hypothetical protein